MRARWSIPATPRQWPPRSRRLLDDDGYAVECAARGVQRASQFNWDRTARLVYDVYVQAVEARQPAARTR